MTRESDIERYLVRRVKAAGGEVRKVKWIGRAGAPDRLVCLPHRMPVFVELKAPGVGLEDHQRREHERLRELNVNVVTIDSIAGIDALLS